MEKRRNPTREQKQWLRGKNRSRLLRRALQYALVALTVFFVGRQLLFPTRYDSQAALRQAAQPSQSDDVPLTNEAASRDGFIAISYAGLTTVDRTNLVYSENCNEQLDALRMNGFQTISQEQALGWLRSGATLPARSMMLLFEDGISNTTLLAQSALERNGFLATVNTYGENLSATNSRYLSVADVKALQANSFWELGCGGWRLSYINVFDRYGNSFGHLNTNEYLGVRDYLKRDYNHYLMDFLRDEDRMRTETVRDMQERIAADYRLMRTTYTSAFGAMPRLSILMHANTGMFGTDPLASEENRKQLAALFSLNFNRMGSCFNTRAASAYDLTRMQIQPYWSVNCMLMHIWDDTGRTVSFVGGDDQGDWETFEGASQFKNDGIILTSEPRAYGRMLLRRVRTADLTLSVTLDGNVYGRQAIYLRSDRRLQNGLVISIDRNVLSVCDLSGGKEQLLVTQDLFETDGGSTQSVEENELEGLIAAQRAILTYDTDDVRKQAAATELERLTGLRARTIAEGAEGYVPAIDVAQRGSRRLEIELIGQRLTVRVDGHTVVKQLEIAASDAGILALESSPLLHEWQEYSQRNVYEDVYDGVFTELTLKASDGSVLYTMAKAPTTHLWQKLRDAIDRVVTFALEHF